MDQWDRNTLWGQGALIYRDQIGRVNDEGDWDVAVIVSHDCDVANSPEVEPYIEVIPATFVEHPDGNLQYAKNPRRIHLPAVDFEKEHLGYVDLRAPCKFPIDKESLLGSEPKVGWIAESGVNALQDWLSARYRRHALPESLADRINGALRKLESKLRTKGEEIIGVWLSYDPRCELEDGDPYELSFYVVFSIECPGAQASSEDVVEYFRRSLEEPEGIIVGEAEAFSEDEFTLRDLRTTEQLRFDFISNRIGPHAPTAE